MLLQLEPVTWAQLAADGVFVLDTSSLLVLWLGRAANLIEKIFGAKVRVTTIIYHQYYLLELEQVTWAQLAFDGVHALAPALARIRPSLSCSRET